MTKTECIVSVVNYLEMLDFFLVKNAEKFIRGVAMKKSKEIFVSKYEMIKTSCNLFGRMAVYSIGGVVPHVLTMTQTSRPL
jgi:hypothetical protein